MLFDRHRFLWDLIPALDTSVPSQSCWMFLRRRLSTWRGRLFKHGKMRINDHSPFAWWNPYGKKVWDWKSGGRTQMEKKWKVLEDIFSHCWVPWYWIWSDDTWMQLVFENCNAVYHLQHEKKVFPPESGGIVLNRDLCVCSATISCRYWLACMAAIIIHRWTSFFQLFVSRADICHQRHQRC